MAPCRRWRRTALCAIAAAIAAVLVPAAAAAAKTLFVATGGSDHNPCTRAAPCRHIVHAVSVAHGGDRIDLGRGQFAENVNLPARLGPITIKGAGARATVVFGDFTGSVFTVEDRATLSNLSIFGGSAANGGGVNVTRTGSLTLDDDSVSYNSAIYGGGVAVVGDGALTIHNTAIFNNQATTVGGGIAVEAGYRTVSVTDSALYRNVVTGDGGEGGGVFSQSLNPVAVTFARDTIAANVVAGANGRGGGIFGRVGTLDGDTIAGNTAVVGGGVFARAARPSGSDTIIAGNDGGNCAAPFASGSYDLEDDPGASCGFSAADHDIVGTDPHLGGLAAHGGPTKTMAPAADSVAIDNGSCAARTKDLRLGLDQRGRPRRFAQRGVCDIGAYDSGGSESGLLVGTGGLPEATVGLPFRVALQASGGVGRPYTWSPISGALAPGLSLSSAGVISGTPTRRGSFVFAAEVIDAASPAPHAATQALALTVYPAPQPAVWVANPTHVELASFPLPANGDAAVAQTLSGHLTGLVEPEALTFDPWGDLFVADAGLPAIWIYQSGAGGDAMPVRAIVGSATGLNGPAGIALGPGRTLYVADATSDVITEYHAGASGNVAPIRTIAGPHTGLAQPGALALDLAGHLWVTNAESRVLTEYAPGAAGDARPLARIPREIYPPLALAVTPPLAIVARRLPSAVVRARYRHRLAALLGRHPLVWRLIRGRLPRGLRLTRGGLITGKPRRLGTFRVTVAARDASRPAMRATARIALTVRRRPVIRSVRPRRGALAGGRRVTIVGRHLGGRLGGTTLSFGRVRAIRVHCFGPGRCTAWAPPHGAGAVPVTVTVDGISSLVRRAPRYRYHGVSRAPRHRHHGAPRAPRPRHQLSSRGARSGR